MLGGLKPASAIAFKKLKFKPKYSFYKLVEDMIKSDLELAKKEKTK